MARLYLDTSAPVVADTIAASSPISTAVAHAVYIVPVGHAALNEDKTPDGAKTVSDLTMLLFLMDTLGFLKYHSNECDGYVADVIFEGTAIG